jgi:hypothetical protein
MKRKTMSLELILEIRKAIQIIEEVDRLYPTDFDCALALTGRFDEPDTWNCKKCGKPIQNEEKYKLRDRRAYKCSNCATINYITADTPFQSCHEPRARLCLIKVSEQHLVLCAAIMDKLLGVAGSTVWRMGRVVAAVIGQSFSSENARSIASAEFLSVFGRRSLDSMRREHPEMEQEAYENDLKQQDAAAQSCAQKTVADEECPQEYELDEAEALVYSILSAELQNVDRICDQCPFSVGRVLGILTILEMLGMIVRLPGNYFVRKWPSESCSQAANDPSKETSTASIDIAVDPERHNAISSFKAFVYRVFHGVSRKHLQSYLSLYWLKVSDRWQNGGLLRAWRDAPADVCLNACSMVSPLLVWLPRCET